MNIYKCDPAKNTECSGYGFGCGTYCGMTTKKECSTDGKPLTEAEQDALQREIDAKTAENNREAAT